MQMNSRKTLNNAKINEHVMDRRDMLRTAGAVAVAASAFPMQWVAAGGTKEQKVLYFSRSAGFEHGAVKVANGRPSISDRILTELGKRHGFEVTCTKDGRVFDGDLDQYDAIAFYTSGVLTEPNKAKTPPMSPEGKKKLLQAIAAGKGFVGLHAATDSFHSHGAQQEATIRAASRRFPGVKEFGRVQKLNEEWYTLKNFAKDLHVILIEDNEGMTGDCYQRPPFPATWARMHDKGRVFYTSFGHRDDIWTNPDVQGIIAGGLAWAMGNVKVNVKPNIDKVTPKASQLKY